MENNNLSFTLSVSGINGTGHVDLASFTVSSEEHGEWGKDLSETVKKEVCSMISHMLATSITPQEVRECIDNYAGGEGN